MSSAAEFDTYGWTEEELDNYLEGLGLPDANLAVLTETDDAYEIRPTNDKAEFDAHCVDFAVHNEFTDHEDSRPYFEALGLDFKKKLTLGTAFSLTALSNEVRLCFLRGHSFFFLLVLRFLCFRKVWFGVNAIFFIQLRGEVHVCLTATLSTCFGNLRYM